MLSCARLAPPWVRLAWGALYYPDVYFVHVTGWLTGPNMAQVFPSEEAARQWTKLSEITIWMGLSNDVLQALEDKTGELKAMRRRRVPGRSTRK